MTEYTFTLKYRLSDSDCDHETLIGRLGAAGCDDALIGVGQPGRIALTGASRRPNRRCGTRLAPCPGKHVRAMLERCEGRGLLADSGLKGFGGGTGQRGVAHSHQRATPGADPAGPSSQPVAQGIWSWSAALRAGELADGGLGEDRAAVTLDDALNNRQAHAGALELSLGMQSLED